MTVAEHAEKKQQGGSHASQLRREERDGPAAQAMAGNANVLTQMERQMNESPRAVAQAELAALANRETTQTKPLEEMPGSAASGAAQRAGERSSAAAQMLNRRPAVQAQVRLGKSLNAGTGGVAQAKEAGNRTGLPDNLKSGVENLSGMSMDDVKVHYNSPQPAGLSALAYAQGSDIHVAPGQERHLPHEAWHVAQQRQGRVAATTEVRGVPVNDNASLEREADEMGARATEAPPAQRVLAAPASSGGIVQGVFDATTFSELIEEQSGIQDYPESSFENGFTTVGFEHEFAQLGNGPLKGLTHVEVAHSTNKLDFTGLGFSLETDADNALELVSPPFLMEIVSKDTPVPNPDHVQKADTMIKDSLATAVSTPTTLDALVTGFKDDPGITFNLIDAEVKSSNVNPEAKLPEGERETGSTLTLGKGTLKDTEVKASRKVGHKIDISSQVNFATNAGTYHDIKAIRAGDAESDYDKVFAGAKKQILDLLMGRKAARANGLTTTGNVDVFLDEMARVLSGHMAIRSLHEAEAAKAKLFKGDHLSKQESNKLSKGKPQVIYKFHTGMRSHVKDLQGVWLKDTLANFGLGLLTPDEWKLVQRLSSDRTVQAGIGSLTKPATGFSKEEKLELDSNLAAAKTSIVTAMKLLAKDIGVGRWMDSNRTEPSTSETHGPGGRLPFGSHDPKWIGARQDTYIPQDKVKRPSTWKGGRLHVVEGRGNALTTLFELKVAHLIRAGGTNKKIAETLGREEITETRVGEIRTAIGL